MPTQGSRTRPGLHAVAHYVGSSFFSDADPGLADSPWATCCRPLRGLIVLLTCRPRAGGLALGYMLSPTTWAHRSSHMPTRARGLSLGYMLSPTTWARCFLNVAVR